MTKKHRMVNSVAAAFACTVALGIANAQDNGCGSLPGQGALKSALNTAVAVEVSGLNNQMWATIVDRDGIVCAVAYCGTNRGAQWPGSRVISAQKANTANAFSLDASSHSGSGSAASGQANGLALSTANLYSAVQPGGSLFRLQESNPVATGVAYSGPSSAYGQFNDPMVGSKIGGINVFGGGLALYAQGHQIVGGVGVSGDTSCADHNIAWRVRNLLGLDHLGANNTNSNAIAAVGGVSGDATRPDNIVFDITNGVSAGGFGHPTCLNTNPPANPALPVVQP